MRAAAPGPSGGLLAALLLAPGAAAADPQFSFPVACTLGRDCFVQNYVDTDMSAAARDFTCGSLSYDGHKGTDIRLKHYVAMAAGFEVLAAAPGTVLRTRDGMADVSVKEIGAAAIKNREAGNSVIVDHGDGWVTQYSHMRKGSVAVKPGQAVTAGTPLGLIGLSGNTEFPHLHFEVRHDDRSIDPFSGEPVAAGCGLASHGLWKIELPYIPTGLLGDGFALERPKVDAARHGAYAATALTIESPALVYWIDVFGLQAGDRLRITLTDPDGAILAESETPIDRPKAQYFAFAGARHPGRGWKSGSYIGRLEVVRGDRIVVTKQNQMALP
jgi:hypothetical protein